MFLVICNPTIKNISFLYLILSFKNNDAMCVVRFHLAATQGKLDVINHLLAHKADTNAIDAQGKFTNNDRLYGSLLGKSTCLVKSPSPFMGNKLNLGVICQRTLGTYICSCL